MTHTTTPALATYVAWHWMPDDLRCYFYCSIDCLAYDLRDTLDGNAPIVGGTVDLGDGWAVEVCDLGTADPYDWAKTCECDERDCMFGEDDD